jgi:arylsulfatase A-like enzyme
VLNITFLTILIIDTNNFGFSLNKNILKMIQFIARSVILINIVAHQIFGRESGEMFEMQSNNKPNIILILADDLAVNAVSAYNELLIKTPNIDRLADEGIKFNNCFVTNSICAPSRAVMLTGKYSHKNGLRDNRDVFDGDQVTFPKLLQNAGYQTALVGKWHLKSEPQGFDYWNIIKGQGTYYNPKFISKNDTTKHIGYTTDLITDAALEYLVNVASDKPFCLLYNHKAPHRNFMPNVNDLREYKIHPEPETLFDDYMGRSAAASEQDLEIRNMYNSLDLKIHLKEGEKDSSGGKRTWDVTRSWNNIYNSLTPEQKAAWDKYYDPINYQFRKSNLTGKELLKWKYQRYINDYLLCVKSIDENLGRLLNYLDENNLSENTIVILTSDQGFFLGEHGYYDKRFMYEESLQIPMLVRYPKEIKPGLVSENIVLNLDFAPTLLDYAGVEIPDDMQGESIRKLAKGEPVENWRTSMYYHYYEYPHGWHNVKRHYGIRTERYKLIHFYNDIDEWELYDLQEDPNEIKNIYNEESNEELINILKIELDELKKKYGDE